MHVRIRFFGKPDTVVVVPSRLSTIDQFRNIVERKLGVEPDLQKLFYGGKLLENGYTFHDYNIKLNDVIQLMVRERSDSNSADEEETEDVVTTSATRVEYKDAVCKLFELGDFIDMRDQVSGSWLEGKITRIVIDPTKQDKDEKNCKSINEAEAEVFSSTSDTEGDIENKPPCVKDEVELCDSTTAKMSSKTKNKGIEKYFSKLPKVEQTTKTKDECDVDSFLLYKVELETVEYDEAEIYCKLKDIRPRARQELGFKDLHVGQTVMINYNIDEPLEKGNWYDFKITELKKTRSSYELVGTLYIGPDAIPQNDTKVKVHDKIYAIEKAVPIEGMTKERKELMGTPTEKRAVPFNCLTCRDDEEAQCKDCGCYLCSGKDSPDKILLCDECNKGFHMICLSPPLTELPKEDWYCPSCKTDPNDVIAPGASKQAKKTSKSNRDWGRGMACVGKTKTCAMPPNHFGPIPGIEVGMCWRFRIQLSETGVHRPPVSGIHGRDVEGAYSIVLSGGYEDDVDNGIEFTYTGSGGRDLSGNRRTAEQSSDQILTRENKALARNCAVKQISEEGGDAGDDWRSGKPVRVVRSYKMRKHFPKYAPKEGIRYDGIYKVVKYYPETGLSGFRVWKYLLRRDDPSPAPWEPEGKEYPIIYPDGYLEAEAEKNALKFKNKLNNGNASKSDITRSKRALMESNQSSELDNSPTSKRRKISSDEEEETNKKAKPLKKNKLKSSLNNPKKKPKVKKITEQVPSVLSVLSDDEKAAIDADTLNKKIWDECLVVLNTKGKKEFVESITEEFRCIICQDMVTSPVTTPCLHNFCNVCIKQAFKASGEQCPCCRKSLPDFEFESNEQLKTALRSILPGYDAGKK